MTRHYCSYEIHRLVSDETVYLFSGLFLLLLLATFTFPVRLSQCSFLASSIHLHLAGFRIKFFFPIVFLALGEAVQFHCTQEVLDEISAQTPTECILFSSGPSVM